MQPTIHRTKLPGLQDVMHKCCPQVLHLLLLRRRRTGVWQPLELKNLAVLSWFAHLVFM